MRERDPELVARPSRLRALAELEANAQSVLAQALDRIARTACRVLDVPVVLVNLVGADQQRFVGCEGPEPWPSTREMPITAGFCPFVVSADEPYTLADARSDPESAANPAVQQFGVVAYAGVPLRTTDGEPVGTLCAIDYEPRTWSAEDLGLLDGPRRGRDRGTAGAGRDPRRRAPSGRRARADRTGPRAASGRTPCCGRSRASARPDFAKLTPDESARLTAAAQAGEPVAELPLEPGGTLAASFASERTFTDDDRAHLAAVGAIAALAG